MRGGGDGHVMDVGGPGVGIGVDRGAAGAASVGGETAVGSRAVDADGGSGGRVWEGGALVAAVVTAAVAGLGVGSLAGRDIGVVVLGRPLAGVGGLGAGADESKVMREGEANGGAAIHVERLGVGSEVERQKGETSVDSARQGSVDGRRGDACYGVLVVRTQQRRVTSEGSEPGAALRGEARRVETEGVGPIWKEFEGLLAK